MSVKPLVSIITPSFQQAAFLENTILSVLNQRYPNLEYLVVDGGSTDESLNIIQRYADKIAWWVSEPDTGQAEGINKGFEQANGEIIAWLNSDDLYLPGTIEAAVTALEEHPDCGMVFADMLAIDASGSLTNSLVYGEWGLQELMRFQIIGQPSVFMRKKALEKAGFLDARYHLLLDHHLWLRMAQLAPIQYIHNFWAAARYHAEAKNIAQAAEFGAEAYRIVEWMKTQPGLTRLYNIDHRRILAGAHRMNARYLLDGGFAGRAFRSYLSCLGASAPVALQEWRRILFAAASPIVNMDRLRSRFLSRREERMFQALPDDLMESLQQAVHAAPVERPEK